MSKKWGESSDRISELALHLCRTKIRFFKSLQLSNCLATEDIFIENDRFTFPENAFTEKATFMKRQNVQFIKFPKLSMRRIKIFN